MKIRSAFLSTVYIIAFFSFMAHGATVELNDGRRIKGEILEQNDRWYTVMVDGGPVQLPRSQISKVIANQNEKIVDRLPNEETRLSPPYISPSGIAEVAPGISPRRDEEPINVSYQAPASRIEPATVRRPAAPPEVTLPLPDAAEQARLQDAIDSLRAEESFDTRAVAEATLNTAGDGGLAVLASYGLNHPRPSVRTESARLLASYGGPRVLKYLIEAFWSASVSPTPPYQLAYVKTLSIWISRLTGADFTVYVWRTTEAPQLADDMVAWWNANLLKLPPQMGEPRIDPLSANYRDNLRSMRALNLEKRRYADSTVPAELLGGNIPLAPEERNTYLMMPEQFDGLQRKSPLR